jgi:hypothetical protein
VPGKYLNYIRTAQILSSSSIIHHPTQGFFSGKRGAGTHKRGKDKHTESIVTISLSCNGWINTQQWTANATVEES